MNAKSPTQVIGHSCCLARTTAWLRCGTTRPRHAYRRWRGTRTTCPPSCSTPSCRCANHFLVYIAAATKLLAFCVRRHVPQGAAGAPFRQPTLARRKDNSPSTESSGQSSWRGAFLPPNSWSSVSAVLFHPELPVRLAGSHIFFAERSCCIAPYPRVEAALAWSSDACQSV